MKTPFNLHKYVDDPKEFERAVIKLSEHLVTQNVGETFLSTEYSVDTTPRFLYQTGFPTLDKAMRYADEPIGGIRDGDLIVVSGSTGHGKTTFILSLINQLNKNHGEKPLFLPLEMGGKAVIRKLRAGMRQLPVFALPASEKEGDIGWVLERIVEARLKYNTRVVFIDHLQSLFTPDMFLGRSASLSVSIGQITQILKHFAVRFGIAIVLVAHCKNRVDGKLPRKSDIRDSGYIERWANYVLMVHRIKSGGDAEADKLHMEFNEDDKLGLVRLEKNRTLGVFRQANLVLADDGLFYEADYGGFDEF